MKFCPVVPEICGGQVHSPRKERRKRIRIRIRIIKIKIIIRNGAKTISCLGDLIIIHYSTYLYMVCHHK
jgi:hypothetical protein